MLYRTGRDENWAALIQDDGTLLHSKHDQFNFSKHLDYRSGGGAAYTLTIDKVAGRPTFRHRPTGMGMEYSHTGDLIHYTRWTGPISGPGLRLATALASIRATDPSRVTPRW